jgi:hypothetical protein
MKSELKVNNLESTDFPALYTKAGAVVLFETDEYGTVVVGTSNYPLGESSDCFHFTEWQRCPAGFQVVLTQD